MNKIAIGAATITMVFATHALAADMAVKSAPAVPSPAIYNWTGWYVGVNAGASMGKVKTDFNSAPLHGTSFVPGPPLTPGFAFSDTSAPDGFIGGGQIGYNWQYSPLIVVGLEADFQGALEKDSNNLSQSFNFTDPGDLSAHPTQCGVIAFFGSTSPCTTSTNYTTRIDWFGTVRGRLGYVWGNGEVLTYVTGGLAYGQVKVNGTNTVSGFAHIDQAGSFTGNFAVTQAFNESRVNTGWVLGYGTEGHLPGNWLPGNWTWKVESLYMDLGHLDTTSAISTSTIKVGGIGGIGGGQVTTNSHFTDWILRGGLNYRF